MARYPNLLYIHKNRYRSRPRIFWRRIGIGSILAVTFGFFLIFSVCYFEFFAPDAIPLWTSLPESALDAVEPVDDSDESGAVAFPEEEEPGVSRGFVALGDTAGVLLRTWMEAQEVFSLLESCNSVYSLKKFREGQPYAVFYENGDLMRFEYEIDNDKRLLVQREKGREGASDGWLARVEDIEYDVRLEKVEGTIESSLFEAMTGISEQSSLAVRLAEIFAWEINFIRDIQPGDRFRVLVEKRYRDGEFKGYGKMLMAEFINKNSKFEAFLHQDRFGNNAYFNAAGDSLRRAFLKAPLSFTRISSRFNLHRKHPILHTVRAHPAVDYAAPMGTPVKAIGSGVVTFRGQSKGAGNYITLKHSNGYESSYLHLSGFAKNLKQGGRVRQGEVIGYVGSTGYSTGPHLDFRMKKNGQFVNAEKILSPRDESVPKKQLVIFRAERDRCRDYLEGKRNLAGYHLGEASAFP